jgi:transposase
MAYDERFRARAVEYKDGGHTFKQLKEVFGICSATYYEWRKNKEITGFYTPKNERRTRKRKIDPEELKSAVEEKPDTYLREFAEKFNCSITAVHKRLKQLKITYKKDVHLFLKSSEEDRAEYLKKVEKIPINNRVYVDESGVDKCLVREYGRSLRGRRVEDIKRGRKFRRTNIIAAQFKSENNKTVVVAPYCYTEHTTGDFFETWFKTKLVKSIPKGVTIIMDNASFHRKKKLRNLAREA